MQKKFIITLFFVTQFAFGFAQIPTVNLQLWLKADSVEITSGYISTWYDQSDNNNHLVQSIAAKRPAQIFALNNLSFISFDGIDDYLRCNFGTTFTTPNTIFIIYRQNSTAYQKVFDGVDSFHGLRYRNGVVGLRIGATVADYSKSAPFEYCILSCEFNGINSKIYENSLLVKSGTLLGGFLNGFTVGCSYELSTKYFNGSIGEIILYDTVLNTIDRSVVEDYLMDKYAPPLTLGPDIYHLESLCDTTLIVHNTFTNILWSTGETNDTIYVNQTGQYWVQATDIFGRVKSDTINVQFPNPNIQNSSICLGDSVLYAPALIGSFDYLWSDLGSESSKYYKDAGNYWLRLEDSFACFDTVFFSVAVDSFSNKISLGNDTSLCSGNTISLIAGEELCSSFLWTTNGNTSPTQTVSESGWQKIVVENSNGCAASDSIYVTIVGTAPTPGYIVEYLCFGDTTQFIDNSTPQADIASWMWIINENDTLFTQNAEWVFGNVGNQNIELIVEAFSGCSNSLNFQIEILPIPLVSYTNHPICAGVNVSFESVIEVPDGTSISAYLWSIDDMSAGTSATFENVFNQVGDYQISLSVVLSNFCNSTYEKVVNVAESYPLPEFLSLVYPEPNRIVSVYPTQVEFGWNLPLETYFSTIYFATDSSFTNVIHQSENLYTNQYFFILPNLFDTIYWHVEASNYCLESVFSEQRSIKFSSPASVDKLQLWSFADSCNLQTGFVDTLYDLSSNQNHFTQNILSKRPIIISDAIGEYNVISFDGNGKYLQSFFNNSYATPNTLIVLYNQKTDTYQKIFDGIDSFHGLRYRNGQVGMRVGGSVVGYNKNTPFSYIIVSAIFNSASSQIYENSVLKNSGTLPDATLNGITLGSSYEISSKWFNGDIAEIIFYDTVLSDSDRQMVERYLHDKYFPPVNLGYDIRIPYGFCDTAITTAYKPWFTDYEWSTGETDSVIHVNRPGVYSVTVTDIFGFESSDDIRVFYPEVNDFADTVVCFGNSVVWDAELMGDYSFDWYGSSETTRAITIDAEGDYAVIVNDTLGCQYLSDTISFSFDNYEFTASVGPADTSLCAGNRLMLVTNSPETVSYLWSTGSTSPEIVLASSGTYSVTTTNWRGCEANDAIDVTITGTVPVPLFSSEGHCAQNPVYFTDLSTSSDGTINSWTWSINGEIFSTEQNPVLAESNPELETSEPETNEITLVISTDAGCSDFIITPITIYPLPLISFVPEFFCQNAEIEFTSTSAVNGGSVVYNFWEFSEETRVGSITLPRASSLSGVEGQAWYQQREDLREAGSSVTHTFTTAGNHTVKLLSSSNESCTDSLTTEIYVKPAELPVYSVENTCLGRETWFLNQTPYNTVNPGESWHWNFGDGGTASVSNPSHTYAAAGTFNTSVEITFANKCITTASLPVEVYNTPVVDISASDECIGVAFSPASNVSSASGNIISYHWLLGDTDITESVLQNPEFLLSEEGLYPISLEVETQYLCTNSDRDTITVHALPVADFTTSRNWGSVPLWIDFTNASVGASTYVWDFGTGETSTEENPYYIFTDSGSFVVRLLSVSEFGCEDYEEHQIKSVIPVMDVILYNLRSEMSGNYLQTRVYIINNGTLPVNNLEMLLNLGDGKIYREVIEYLAPSQVLDYKFVFEAWIADGTVPELVCAEAIAPAYEGHTDSDLSNNTICNTDVDNLKVLQPYPNPATDQIICEFILSETSDVEISLVNSLGEVVYKTEFKDRTTYTKHIISVKDFVQGVYFLQVRAGSEKVSYKVEVQ